MAEPEPFIPPRNEKGQFLQGLSGNPSGRKVGARAKLGEDFIRDMQTAWEAGGIDVITRVMADRPQDFLKIVASLLPRDVNLNVNNMDDATDDELIQRIRRLDAQIRPFLDLERASDVAGGDGQAATH
jgi:hypothetical protein